MITRENLKEISNGKLLDYIPKVSEEQYTKELQDALDMPGADIPALHETMRRAGKAYYRQLSLRRYLAEYGIDFDTLLKVEDKSRLLQFIADNALPVYPDVAPFPMYEFDYDMWENKLLELARADGIESEDPVQIFYLYRLLPDDESNPINSTKLDAYCAMNGEEKEYSLWELAQAFVVGSVFMSTGDEPQFLMFVTVMRMITALELAERNERNEAGDGLFYSLKSFL